MIPCPSCGANNSEKHKFCARCGFAFSGATGQLTARALLAERYAIVRLLGRGGMGAVYLALDRRLDDMQVAIKEMGTAALEPDELEKAVASFKREALLLVNLRHHALPRVTDFFSTEDGCWFLVMDYIEGETVERVAHRRGPLPEAEVVDWARQLCNVLGYLHGQAPPVIFRDLKPSNVMLTPDNRIKLIDFGIARHFKPGVAMETKPFASIGFAPPEQLGKGRTDQRTDIYALGATMHHLLTGIDPAIDPFKFTPPDQAAGVSPGLGKLIMEMVKQEPGGRPADVGKVEERLTKLTGKSVIRDPKLPILVRIQARLKQAFRQAWRMKIGPVPAVLLSLLLVAVVAGASIFAATRSKKPPVTAPEANIEEGVKIDTDNEIDVERGNSTGNIINDGLAALQGNMLYYVNRDDSGRIYRALSGGSEPIMVNNDDSRCLNTVGDWVYYINVRDGNRIYRVQQDGSGRARVNNDHSWYLNAIGDWIFYTNWDDGHKIYRVRPDGSERTRLHDDDSWCLNVVGDWIIYVNRDDGDKLYRVRLDGSGCTRVANDNAWFPNAVDDWIYYINCDDGHRIYKVHPGGGGRARVNDDYSWFLNAAGNWIYYANKDDGFRIYKIRPDGSGRIRVNDDNSSCLNVVGYWIYYVNEGEGGRIYRVGTDGRHRQVVTTPLVNEERGNSIGNIMNGGFAVAKGEWTYYAHDNIYKLDTDGGGCIKICDDEAMYLNIADDWLFYANLSDDSRIYRIRTDGTDRAKLSDDASGWLNVVGDWIYYAGFGDDWTDCPIFKIRTDGSGRTQLNRDISYYLAATGDWIYYENRMERYKIYKVRRDGGDSTLVQDCYTGRFIVADGWIYYDDCDFENRIFKVRLDGSECTRINNDSSYDLNIAGDWIYYTNEDDGRKIYKIRTDGSGRIRVNDDESRFLNIVEDWIYYVHELGEDDHEICKIRTDGSDRQVVFKSVW